MSKWKLVRQTYGGEVFSLSEGDEITVGRGVNNTITLSSLVISRRHCIIKAFRDNVTVQDLKSSNGTYVDSNKLKAHSTCTVREAGVIGVGWMEGASLAKIANAEKFVFKLLKEKTEKSFSDRIVFQNESEVDEVEDKLVAYISGLENEESEIKPLITDNKNEKKPSIKRKFSSEAVVVKEECVVEPSGNKFSEVVIDLVSESENENENNNNDEEVPFKKIKLEIIPEKLPIANLENIKTEVNENTDYDAFKVKQELLGYDEEPINLDSDSETETERRWLFRLSQSSPGKPLKNPKLIEENNHIQESSYSQIIEDHDESLLGKEDSIDEEFLDDLIIIPENPLPVTNNFTPDMDEVDPEKPFPVTNNFTPDMDEVNGCTQGLSSDYFAKQLNKLPETEKEACARTTAAAAAAVEALIDSIGKKAQLIEPQTHSSKGKTHSLTIKKVEKSSALPTQSKPKSTSSKHSKSKHSHSNSKRHISNSQKEERKKKLKEIAIKEKDPEEKAALNSSSSSKTKVNVKVTNSNRGAFLTETTATVNPMKQKESPQKSHKHIDKEPDNREPDIKEPNIIEPYNKEPITNHVSTSETNVEKCQNIENIKSVDQSNVDENACKTPKRQSRCKEKRNSRSTDSSKKCDSKSVKKTETRVPLKNLKPLTDSEDANSGKPTSKVEPMTVTKPKKRVRFSDAPPQVQYFEIEPGNQMKKTSLVKATQLDVPQKPLFSLEKITLMKILRWNPQWLEEQVNNNEPPPILGHNFPPMTLMYSFQSHDQYVQVVGDLLLMEIWEAITQAFMRKRNFQDNIVQMSIECLPSNPALDRGYEIYPVSVNVSIPKTGVKHLPRLGELMLVWFGPDNAKSSRFFFVHNIKTLPSPPNNMYSYFSITLHTMYTDKMRSLRQGEVMHGRILCYIRNELSLFEAMEYLSRSPLCEMILRPDPRHFLREQHIATQHIKSPWTETLNESQLEAVSCSVRSALSERPSIQMVQGPPGTGKSTVICSIIMAYFYDTRGLRLQGRGKILICATSNAAVDELVIRLLHIRQSLPKTERFRMVRVGRPEAMHAKARDLSSQSLAQRDAQRVHHDPAATKPGLDEEIARAEARLNMWMSNINEAKDPARVAFCQTQLDQIKMRLMQLRGGSAGGGEVSTEQLVLAERRIVEGADIIVTTLSSAANHKIKGLKRRIALCIVDEAGQAIEPETLIPLMLDVTRITLIGDPQQLPGFIGSQRAKQHGLGESLFSRLSSSMEHWTERSPVVLLNVQYRMHPAIADYPNRAFYDGKIRNSVTVRTDLKLPSYSVIYITSGDKGQAAGGGNEMEAWGVARMVVALSALTRQCSLSLAVITPYNAHKELIKKNLRALQDPSVPPVDVNTVDSFQGQERDVVVVSIARSQGAGFLNEAGRMNVMLTRAKHSLLICLNPNALTRNQQWRTLVDDAHKRCLLKYLPNKFCQPTTAAKLANDNILQYITKP